MVEQVQVTPPPYDALASPSIAPDTKSGLSHSNHSVTPTKEDDTVTLSASARASQLYLQGRSVTEISALLGLAPATVDSDLNIAQSSSGAIEPTTAQSPGTQVTPADASTPSNVSSSPYTAPTHTSEKL